jgi:hypothetical protein
MSLERRERTNKKKATLNQKAFHGTSRGISVLLMNRSKVYTRKR